MGWCEVRGEGGFVRWVDERGRGGEVVAVEKASSYVCRVVVFSSFVRGFRRFLCL